MKPRSYAIQLIGERRFRPNETDSMRSSKIFGMHVFSRRVMKEMLSNEIYQNIVNAQEGIEKLREEYADPIAVAMKDWAISLGATHYSHWFQPLTGAIAEKHDAFIDWETSEEVLEKFSGKQLIQGEPDASSFPSGGLRTTYEARGYTGWDPTSPSFVWKAGDGITLCIPSLFYSWTGDVLDNKIPLLRSDHLINLACVRLLKLTGIQAKTVTSTLGFEQEYFVIDRALRNLRPDLIISGRTLFGAPSPKGQELQDHYFGTVKDRILQFMRDFEVEALKLGIPVKTRHNEVAPSQYEVAPVFERASVAVDHNILLMELMRQTALKHHLVCLMHEKPFAGINGSGKHCNWSLVTDSGINLLNPTEPPENNLHFLILLTAVLEAVHEHAILLRASIGSHSNDHRLGGHEAPPAIISVYLGQELEALLENIESKGLSANQKVRGKYDLKIPGLLDLPKDNTDRNRTSPFAFTGNKFEFRAVGSSSSPAFPVTVLNTIVAKSLNRMLDEIELNLNKNGSRSKKLLIESVIPVLRKSLKKSKKIRFSGDNYSTQWKKDAFKRKLPHLEKAVYAFSNIKDQKTIKVFEGVLNTHELKSRSDIELEHYFHTANIETKLMIEMFNTQILPSLIDYQKRICDSISKCQKFVKQADTKKQKARLNEYTKFIERAIELCDSLSQKRMEVEALPLEKRGISYCELIQPLKNSLRDVVDTLEGLTDDALWPHPKYRELVFMI